MKKIFITFLLLTILLPLQAYAKKEPAVSLPDSKGYVGDLPNITDRFQKSIQKDSTPSFEYEEGFNDFESIKNAPRNDPSFVNIIIKRDKNSQYINDLNYLIEIIESLQDTVEDKQNVQRFNAKAYFLKENVEYFRDKYENKAEGSYASFKKVMQLNTRVQSVAQLRKEREAYTPYVSAVQSGNLFSSNNIDVQLDYLLDEIKKTIVALKDTK